MTTSNRPTALIAEDEPLLGAALQAELAHLWPELAVVATVGDGESALTQTLQLLPDVLFFDIRMPGLSGLDAAMALAESWDTRACRGKPFPALVFVTAYDQYAVQAFDAQALDYLLKPLQAVRLEKTVSKLKMALDQRMPSEASSGADVGTQEALLEATLAQLRQVVQAVLPGTTDRAGMVSAVAPLKLIQASQGSNIRMVPVPEVVYFEAADKYVRVLTCEREYLIRTPLKELLPQLDASQFWQIHRGCVVNATCIDSVARNEFGKLVASLRGRSEKLVVSRLYAHLFRAM